MNHLRVLAALSFYADGSYQRRVGMDAFCMMSQTTIHKCVKNISKLITNNLSSTYIQSQQEVNLIKNRFKDDYGDETHIGLAAVSLDVKRRNFNKYTRNS